MSDPVPLPESTRTVRHRGGGWSIAALYDSAYPLLVLALLFWAGNFIVGRAVRDDVPPIALAFGRWFGGFLVVMIVARRHLWRDLPVLMAVWPRILLLSAVGIAAFNTFVYLGLRSTTAINALLEQSVMPVVILLYSYLLFRERVSAAQLAGVLISLLGVVVIVTRGEPLALFHIELNVGDAWVLAAVAAYAAYTALLRLRPAVHPTSFLAATFLLGSMMILPFAIWEELAGNVLRATTPTFLAIGYVAVFPSVLAYFCYNRGVDLIGANRAGQFMHLMPVFGSVLAILLLGEEFRLFHAGGALLIFAGIVLAMRRRTAS
jgi:drug/metabolite transporter (DMT)-like permease